MDAVRAITRVVASTGIRAVRLTTCVSASLARSILLAANGSHGRAAQTLEQARAAPGHASIAQCQPDVPRVPNG